MPNVIQDVLFLVEFSDTYRFVKSIVIICLRGFKGK